MKKTVIGMIGTAIFFSAIQGYSRQIKLSSNGNTNLFVAAGFQKNDTGISTSVDGNWYGWFQPYAWDKYVSFGYYTFKAGKYDLDLTHNPSLVKIVTEERMQGNLYKENGTFFVSKENGLTYIDFKSATGFAFAKRLGALKSDWRLFLYNNDIIWYEPKEDYGWDVDIPNITAVHTSSYLKEGNIQYDGKTFIRTHGVKLLPWVEAASGSGIGEWIEMDIGEFDLLPVKSLLVANGYISFNNSSLFMKNNRVKSYRITSDKLNAPIEGELEDTPDLQEIALPKEIPCPVTLRFEIRSVYKGEKYDDTCISLIYPLPPDMTGKRAPR